MFSDPATLAAARSWYASNPFTAAGDAGRDEDLDRALQALLSQNPTTATAAKNWAMSITTPLNAHGTASDDARYLGEALICTYDWCYDAFSESERATFVARWNAEWDFWNNQSWGGSRFDAYRNIPMYSNNYYWGYLRNSFMWGIATAGESGNDAATFLADAIETRWEDEFVPATQSLTPAYENSHLGGAMPEGSQYGVYTPLYSIIPFTTAHNLGRSIYGETNYVNEVVCHIIYATSPTSITHGGLYSGLNSGRELPPWNDDQFWRYGGYLQDHSSNIFDLVLRGYLSVYPSTNLARWSKQWLNDMAYTRVRYLQACLEPSVTALDYRSSWPYDYYVPGTGDLYGRSSWSNSATAFVYHGSQVSGVLGAGGDASTVGHRHTNIGSVQIQRNGRWLTRNAAAYGEDISQANPGGRGSPDSSQGMLGHNALLVATAGSPESTYTLWHANNQGGTNKVERLHYHADFDYIANEFADCYDGLCTTRWREVVFVRAIETFVIVDRVTTSTSQVHTQLWHSETSPTTIDAATTQLVNGTQELRVTTLLPASPTRRTVTETNITAGNVIGQYRLELDSASATQGYMITVLQAFTNGGSALTPSITDNGTYWTITLDGSRSVRIEKGADSSGGSVTLSSVTTNFNAGVQSIAVDQTNGPVWGA